MKYKSELIKEIVEARGHEKSSLHYESECIAYWIETIRGAYPKLMDYEGEWLYYYLENDGIGKFPYLAINNIISTTIENAVPIPFKSAILNGQTLVNLINLENFTSSDILYTCDLPIKNNTTYTVIATLRGSDKIRTSDETVFRIKDNNDNGNDLINIQQIMPNDISTIINLCQTIKITTQNNLHIRLYNTLPENLKIIILEGDHTQEDIPYFEGMASVKMPVLTTTGKNLFNKEDFYSDWKSKQSNYIYKEVVDGEEVLKINNYNALWANNKGFKINVKKNTPYTFSFDAKKAGSKGTNAIFVVRSDDGEDAATRKTVGVLGEETDWKRFAITITPTRGYITICSGYNANDYFFIKNLQLSESVNEMVYEPYKTNILTVNEDVTLRSNGSVYDELDLLTGKLTQRIDENNEVLAQAVVKTVDLSIIDESGNNVSKLKAMNGITHIETNGTPLKPTFSGEIPVEAITQNLYSITEEE